LNEHAHRASTADRQPAPEARHRPLAPLGGNGANAPSAANGLPWLTLTLALISLLLVPVAAFGATPELESKGPFGSAAQPSFAEARGLAVDQSNGDLYVFSKDVLEIPNITRWHEDGTPDNFSALGSTNAIDAMSGADQTPQEGFNFPPFSAGEFQLAIDDSGTSTNGDIYVTQTEQKLIDIFSSAGQYLGQLTEYKTGPDAEGSLTEFGEVCGVAVGADGSVYVGDYGGEVHKFQPSASPVTNANSVANYAIAGVAHPCTLAVGAGPTAGSLFVNAYPEAGNELLKLDGATGATKYGVSSGNTTISINPADGHLFAVAGSALVEWDASGSTTAVEVSNTPLSGEGQGVAVDGGSGNVYVSEAGDPDIEVYGPRVEPTVSLTIAESGSGSGSVTVECEEGSGFESCSSPLTALPEGTEVNVRATPGSGSELKEFSGTNSAASCGPAVPAGATCSFTVAEDSVITAKFDLEPVGPQTLMVEVEGEGSVSAAGSPTPVSGGIANCEEVGGQCSAVYAEASRVTLTATAGGSSHFVGWTTMEGDAGTCVGASTSCEAGPLVGPTKLKAVFEATTTSLLAVYVTGSGTVSADSGPIVGCTEAGGPACEGQYEGTVVLTESPGAGDVFAGWLGCKHKTATQCEVELSGAKEVYAVFLKEGTAGSPGSPGKNIALVAITSAGLEGHCVGVGGIRIEVEGEPATRQYVCNGEHGLQGSPGTPGATGPQGPAGATGSTGAQGATGSAGPQGPAGPEGPAGKNAKVTCKVQQNNGSTKARVTCTVKYQGGKAAGSAVHWRLIKRGHVIRRGLLGPRHSRLDLSGLVAGEYRLHVEGQEGNQLIVIA
jgi:Collagen triple helix repeat (20 copies)/Divergent InlB B-repeat domain